MSVLPPSSLEPAITPLRYAQASLAQREQLLATLRQHLRNHFPSLSPAAWLRALFEFQPTLLLAERDNITLGKEELTQLVQHVAACPELPVLDPPIYGRPALELAQRWLRGRELAAAALGAVAAGPSCPQLTALLTYLCQPYPLAEQVVQAWRWDLASSPALPMGIPGGGIIPDSPEVARLLKQLGAHPQQASA